jgi:trigger factor
VKSAVETLGPTRAKLTVEVPFDELKPSLDAAYKKIAQQITVPGFRRGKVPPPVIDRQVGRGAVLDQALNDALPQIYLEAVQVNDLSPLTQPEIDITRFEDNDGLEFTAEMDVRPELDLPAYDGLSVTVDDAVVTDEDVEEQLTHLRERFATLADVDRPAEEDDFVVMDLRASRDGEPVEGAEASQMSYQVGSGGMIDGLDETLTGMSAGDERTFASKLVAGDAEGQDVEVSVTVSAVKEQKLPALDDEFAQLASEFDTVAELTDDIRVRLEGGKRLEQAADARDAVLERLLDLVEVPLPDGMVAAELQARREALQQQLTAAGLTLEGYLDAQEQTVDEFEAQLEKSVRDAVAAQFVLDAIAAKEEIGVDQSELTEHMLRRAQQSGQNPNDYVKHMVEHNHVPELVTEVVRGKALASVVESATVTDASGTVVDLKNLRGDGTVGPPEEDAAGAGDQTDVPAAADPAEAAEAAEEPDRSAEAAEDVEPAKE